MSTEKVPVQLAIDISSFGVHHLPDHVRERWAVWEDSGIAHEGIEARLLGATKRREDFQQWVSEKAKVRNRSFDHDNDKLQVLKRLEAKLATAQLNREKELEAVRTRAASLAAPRTEAVASRQEQRAEEVAQKLQHNLEAAEKRRQARMDAAKERLSAAHELVFARMAKSMDQEKRCSSEKRRRINSRLSKAEDARREQLAAVAGKAGGVVERARQVTRMARLTAEQSAHRRRSQLTDRLEAAAERRSRRQVSSSHYDEVEAAGQLGHAEQRRLEELVASLRARHLQTTWRNFMRKRKTTATLAVTFVESGVPGLTVAGDRTKGSSGGSSSALVEEMQETHVPGGVVMIGGMSGGQSPKHAEFESFVERLQSASTLRAAQALLRRLEVRLHAQGVADASSAALLRRLFPRAPRNSQLERYPTRVFLCAYMILQHPEVVFSSLGEREAQLSRSAKDMVEAFENLLARILQPPVPTAASSAAVTPMSSPREPSFMAASAVCPSPLKAGMQAYRNAKRLGEEPAASGWTRVGELLVLFDEVWLGYLDQFVAWKSHDAESLVGELVRMGGQLELSLQKKLGTGGQPDAMESRLRGNTDLQAMVAQVAHDHHLLRERIEKLAGEAGVQRLEAALTAAREQAIAESDSDWETDRSNPPSRRPSSAGGSLAPSSQSSPSRSHDPAAAAASVDAASSSATPAPGPRASGNEQVVWELLFNPAYRLPSEEADTTWDRAMSAPSTPSATPVQDPAESLTLADLEGLTPAELTSILKRRAVSIAERAFWDSVAEALARGLRAGDLAGVLSPMLVELGGDLAGAMGEGRAAEDMKERFSEALVMQQLTNGGGGGGNSLMRSMEMLQQLSQALISLGSEAREAAAQAAQQRVGAALHAAASASGADAAAQVVAGLVSALRLMFAQLKLLKLDLANARLTMLGKTLQTVGAASYLQTKFAASYELPDPAEATAAALASKLPRSAAWLAQVRSSLPLMEQRLLSMGVAVEALEAAGRGSSGISQALPQMYSGLRSPLRSSADGAAKAASTAALALRPQYPTQLRSWRGVLRWGVVSLAVQEAAAVDGLPEVLDGQAERINWAQNRLQQLLVATAGLLIAQQVRQRGGRAAWTEEERQHAKVRVLTVLADPNMRLDVLVALLGQLAGVATPEEEAQLRGAFRTLVSSGSGAYRAINGALCGVLLVRVLLGSDLLAGSEEVSRGVASALARSGASLMADELAKLAEELALLAAAGEAVHGPLYEIMLSQ